MVTKRMTTVLAVLLALAFVVTSAAPVFAGEEAKIEGTIDKIIMGDMLPEHAQAMGITKVLVVDGVHVLLNGDTEIDGMLKVGAEVETEGDVRAVLAETIGVVEDVDFDLDVDDDEVELTGTIEKIIYKDMLPEHAIAMGVTKVLVVDGTKVIVTESTEIGGKLMVGTEIEVEGTVHALLADKVKVED